MPFGWIWYALRPCPPRARWAKAPVARFEQLILELILW